MDDETEEGDEEEVDDHQTDESGQSMSKTGVFCTCGYDWILLSLDDMISKLS